MTETTQSSSKPSLWARCKSHILHPELSPSIVAWSFAIGFCISWNPFLGLHTWMVIVLCLVFRRLHRPLMFLAVFINNPWTMVPMATASTLMGNVLLGRGCHINLSSIHWGEIGWRSFVTVDGFWATYRMIEPILGPYLLGGMVFSILALPVGYFVMKKVAERLRKAHLHLPHLNLPHGDKPSNPEP